MSFPIRRSIGSSLLRDMANATQKIQQLQRRTPAPTAIPIIRPVSSSSSDGDGVPVLGGIVVPLIGAFDVVGSRVPLFVGVGSGVGAGVGVGAPVGQGVDVGVGP